MAIEDNPISRETFDFMRAKTRTYVKLVKYLRQQQMLYFKYKRTSNEQNAQKKLLACFELEKRVDEESENMLDLVKSHFQTELFR